MTGIAKAEAIRLALGLGVLGVTVTGLSTVATGAFFTSTNHVAPKIVAGTVSLTTTPTSAAFNVTDLAPGDIRYSTITVKNSGTLASRYSLGASVNGATPNLASQLSLAAVATDAPCGADAFTTGSLLFATDGPLSSKMLFGDTTRGAQAGDRPLSAGQSETLCFRASLPSDVDNKFQGKSAAMTFDFYSEQTANNP
ncbi:MAG TPA: TasA family protein [Oryzihumus sp.]|nr:TasA family protein [Oryzihumus sp.]